MGCDIHAVIEVERYGSYQSFAEVRIGRDDDLFSAIAFGDGGVTDDLPYPPRGLPADFGLTVTELFFVDANEIRHLEAALEGEEDFKPEEIARGWGDWALETYKSLGLLPGPDWHTPGWLNVNELNDALSHARLKPEKQSVEFQAVLAAMRVLANNYGADKVRLVFWFDG